MTTTHTNLHEQAMIDLTEPEKVEIIIRDDGRVVWVNVDGLCRLRACRIQSLQLQDDRRKDGKQDVR